MEDGQKELSTNFAKMTKGPWQRPSSPQPPPQLCQRRCSLRRRAKHPSAWVDPSSSPWVCQGLVASPTPAVAGAPSPATSPAAAAAPACPGAAFRASRAVRQEPRVSLGAAAKVGQASQVASLVGCQLATREVAAMAIPSWVLDLSSQVVVAGYLASPELPQGLWGPAPPVPHLRGAGPGWAHPPWPTPPAEGGGHSWTKCLRHDLPNVQPASLRIDGNTTRPSTLLTCRQVHYSESPKVWDEHVTANSNCKIPHLLFCREHWMHDSCDQ